MPSPRPALTAEPRGRDEPNRLQPDGPVVVVGAGHAGGQFAISLREHGHRGPITVLGDEGCLPYQRPPLSKAGDLTHPLDVSDVQLRERSTYERLRVTLRCGDAVSHVHREDRFVTLASGDRLGYAHLVLATGARARSLDVPGADLRGVLSLRTLAGANRVRSLLARSLRAVVIGGGLIGMEIAAAAAARGQPVTIVEAGDRAMAPAVSPAVTEHVARVHDAHGNLLLARSSVVSFVDDGSGGVAGVQLADGRTLPADLVVVAIGVEPNTALAAEAGLPVTHGIEVDTSLLTADRHISAIGDCASFPSPHAGHRVRLESVQNAVDQARFLAARLTGTGGEYDAVPWFWSDQLDLKLQFVGLGSETDSYIVLGDANDGSFSVLRFADGHLVRVESVNRPRDHVAARRILATVCCRPTPADVHSIGLSAWARRDCTHRVR